MYKVGDYGSMIVDRTRMVPYIEALRRAVKPGCVVIDLGAGTGIFSLLACRFGARKVYAIEPNDAIFVARRIAAANGYADRIECIQDLSTDVTLSERADVIVSDMRGILPLLGSNLAALKDARERLLAPGGALIPQRDELVASIVNAPLQYAEYVKAWDEFSQGFDMGEARRLNVNTWGYAALGQTQLMVKPQTWAVIDYCNIESINFGAKLEWVVERPGEAHGIVSWFDTALYEDVGFSNSPGNTAAVYGCGFFPWERPVDLEVGDKAEIEISANLAGDDYVWRWKTIIRRAGAADEKKAEFDQSTFAGEIITPAQLRRQSSVYAPILNEDGLIDQYILGLMDGKRDQGEIARLVMERFPHRFTNDRDSLVRVSAVSGKYGI